MTKYISIVEIDAVPMTSCEFHDVSTDDGYENEEGHLVTHIGGSKGGTPMWVNKAEFEKYYFRTSYEESEFDNMSVPELAITLKNLKERLEEMGVIKTEIQKAYDFLSIAILPDRMDEEGIQTLKIKDVGRLQSKTDIRCSVPAKNKEAVAEWLNEHGHGSMISETINSSTLKAFVREMMKEDKEWPKDLLKVEPYSRATVVKA